MKKEPDNKKLLSRSAETGEFFKKQGFNDLGDIIDYAIRKSNI